MVSLRSIMRTVVIVTALVSTAASAERRNLQDGSSNPSPTITAPAPSQQPPGIPTEVPSAGSSGSSDSDDDTPSPSQTSAPGNGSSNGDDSGSSDLSFSSSTGSSTSRSGSSVDSGDQGSSFDASHPCSPLDPFCIPDTTPPDSDTSSGSDGSATASPSTSNSDDNSGSDGSATASPSTSGSGSDSGSNGNPITLPPSDSDSGSDSGSSGNPITSPPPGSDSGSDSGSSGNPITLPPSTSDSGDNSGSDGSATASPSTSGSGSDSGSSGNPITLPPSTSGSGSDSGSSGSPTTSPSSSASNADSGSGEDPITTPSSSASGDYSGSVSIPSAPPSLSGSSSGTPSSDNSNDATSPPNGSTGAPSSASESGAPSTSSSGTGTDSGSVNESPVEGDGSDSGIETELPNVDVPIATETNPPSPIRDPDNGNDLGNANDQQDVIVYNSKDYDDPTDPFGVPDISDDSASYIGTQQPLTTDSEPDDESEAREYRRSPIDRGDNDRPQVASENVLTGANATFHDFMRYSSVVFAAVSLALLVFFHYILLDPTLVWASATWSPNTWEFLLYGAYLQQLSSISHLTLTKTPYWLYTQTDAFSWVNFLIERNGDDDNASRRLEVTIKEGFVSYGDRIGVPEADLVNSAASGVAIVLALLLLVYIVVVLIARRKAQGVTYSSQGSYNQHSATRLRNFSIRTLGLMVLLWYFALYPLMALSSFEIEMEIDARQVSGSVAVAIICILVSLAFLAVCGRIILHKSREELLQFENLATWGSLYAEFTYNRRMFFMLTGAVQIATGIFVGAVDKTPTQLILLIAVQAVYFISVIVIAPFSESFVRNIVLALTVIKMFNFALAFAWLRSPSTGSSDRDRIAEAFIGINVILILVWFIRHLIIFGMYLRAWIAKDSEEAMTPNASPEVRPSSKHTSSTNPLSGHYAVFRTGNTNDEESQSPDTLTYHMDVESARMRDEASQSPDTSTYRPQDSVRSY